MTSNQGPKYINFARGFAKYLINGSNSTFLGFTRNLRAATPFYGSNGAAVDIARNLAKQALMSDDVDCSYFCIVEPTLIGFNKEKEIL